MPCNVQAGLSSTADKEQEGYRSSLLHRLVPALGAFTNKCYEAASSATEWVSAKRGKVQRLAASCATARPEGCLAHLDDSMLLVRIEIAQEPGIWAS